MRFAQSLPAGNRDLNLPGLVYGTAGKDTGGDLFQKKKKRPSSQAAAESGCISKVVLMSFSPSSSAIHLPKCRLLPSCLRLILVCSGCIH